MPSAPSTRNVTASPPPDTSHLPAEIASAVLGLLGPSELVVAVLDQEDRHRWINRRYGQIFGVPLDTRLSWAELIRLNHGRGIGVQVRTDDLETWITSATARRGKQPYRAIEVDLVDGRWLLMTETSQPGGWLLVLGVEITDFGRDARELRHARDLALRDASSDPLTGLNNRRYAEDRVARQPGRVAESPSTLAVIDLDHFKRINDSLGHAAGDEVLVHFARQLLANSRRDDVCARLGGEEFMLLLPRTSVQQARPVLERLLMQLRQARPLAAQPSFAYTASVGLAESLPGDTVSAWLARADAAMYEAKRSGRDRVRSAAP
jgi:diguanylate cyclase (GGDEF)-like protein